MLVTSSGSSKSWNACLNEGSSAGTLDSSSSSNARIFSRVSFMRFSPFHYGPFSVLWVCHKVVPQASCGVAARACTLAFSAKPVADQGAFAPSRDVSGESQRDSVLQPRVVPTSEGLPLGKPAARVNPNGVAPRLPSRPGRNSFRVVATLHRVTQGRRERANPGLEDAAPLAQVQVVWSAPARKAIRAQRFLALRRANSEQSARMSQMLKSSGAMSAATMLSRVLGLAREVVYARFMGDTWVAGAFTLAFM